MFWNIVRWNIIVEDMLRNNIEQSEQRCYLYICSRVWAIFAHADVNYIAYIYSHPAKPEISQGKSVHLHTISSFLAKVLMAPTSLQVLPLAVSIRSQYSLSDLPEGMKNLPQFLHCLYSTFPLARCINSQRNQSCFGEENKKLLRYIELQKQKKHL